MARRTKRYETMSSAVTMTLVETLVVPSYSLRLKNLVKDSPYVYYFDNEGEIVFMHGRLDI